MNKYIKYLLISCSFFLCGILFFAYQESWIIFNIPQTNIWHNLQKTPTTHTDVRLWAYKNNQWIFETKQIIHSDMISQKIQNILNSWLSLIEEEHITNNKITVESVVLSPTQTTAFISLDQNPFTSQKTTYDCLMLIEGILKTMREQKISVQAVQFLIRHTPWKDYRLNMEIVWPTSGYLNL